MVDYGKNDPVKFENLLKENQAILYSYILKRIFNLDDAKDVLQETNLVIWKKAKEFKPGTSFLSWSRTIAHFQILAYAEKHNRKILKDKKIIDNLQILESEDEGDKFSTLEDCLKKLPKQHFELIDARYYKKRKIEQIAVKENKSINAITKILHRCRMNLLKCIKDNSAGVTIGS